MNPKDRNNSSKKLVRLLIVVALFLSGFAAAYLWQFAHRNPSHVEVTPVPQHSNQSKAESPPALPGPALPPPKFSAAKAAPQPPMPARSAPALLFERLAPSVFVVETLNERGVVVAQGSGVAVGSNDVVTNMHVIQDGTSWRVVQGVKKWAATLTHLDLDHDLCRLRVQGVAAQSASVRLSSTLTVGERVYAIGAPEGLELTFSEGLISRLGEYVGSARLIQTSASISHGSSGGGLFDAQGRLVGITFASSVEGQNLNFVLPADWVLTLENRPISEEQVRVVSAFFQALEWFQLGDTAVQAGHYPDAIAAYKESIRLKADAPASWTNLGLAYNSLQRYDEALVALREATRLNPSMYEAWLNLGYIYIGLHQPDEAGKVLQQAVHLNPEAVGAWTSLGTAYNESQQFREAVSAFSEAVRLKPESAEAFYGLGNAYSGLGRYSEAATAYKEAIRQKPDFEFAWVNLGNTYRRLQRNDEAIEAYREATRLKPDDPFAWEHLGVAYSVAHEYPQAVSNLEHAIQIKSDWAEPWSNLGYVYLAMQQWDRAVETLKEAVRLGPNDATAWVGLGMAYASLGNRSRVDEVYRQLRTISPSKADEFRRQIMDAMGPS